MEEWKSYLMEDIIEEIAMGPFGSNIKVDCFVDSGVPVLNGSNLQGFKLNEESFNYVTEEKANSLNKANAHRGDIVITHRGTLGQIVYIPSDSQYERYVISQSQFRVRLNTQIALPQFVVYFFHTRIGQHRLLANASQVGVPAIARPSTTFKTVPIELPSLEEQMRIVGILDSLSIKIELNNRINYNLEEQAQALFKSWFVDFEPFQDGRIVDSELGTIPKGWDVIPLGDILNYHKRTVNPQKYPDTVFTHYSLPAFDNSKEPEVQKGSEIMSNKIIVENKMILFSKLNPRIKRLWFIDNIPSDSICSTEFIAYKAKEELMSPFCWCYLNGKGFYDSVLSVVNGATGSHQRFHAEETLKYLIPFNREVVLTFSKLVAPILQTILNNESENRALKKTRDTLLPKLMSGEIAV